MKFIATSHLLFFSLAGAVSAAPFYGTPQTAFDPGGTLGGTTIVNNGLVGVGRIGGSILDSFGETMGGSSGLFINNWSYNSGSGEYAGTFNILPDRGYNAGTTFSNYAARLHNAPFTFTPYTGANPVAQTQISTSYGATTKFTYQDGTTTKFTTGLLPTAATNTLFGNLVGTTTAANGPGGAQESLLSFDAEAVHLLADGSGYVSDEYGTYIARFNPSKLITNIIQLPAAARPTISGNPSFGQGITAGRRDNQGLEGLTVSPDGTRLMVLMQSALVQDSAAANQTRLNTRLFTYDISTPVLIEAPALVGEYVVQLPTFDIGGADGAANRTASQSEIVAVSNTQFMMLPRDGNGLGTNSLQPHVVKSIELVDFAGATNIAGTARDFAGGQVSPLGVLDSAIIPAQSTQIINIIANTDLAKFGLNTNDLNAGFQPGPPDANTIAEKWEGMALQPNLATADPNDFYLFVSNDNDFQTSNVQMLNAAGVIPVNGPNAQPQPQPGIDNDVMFLAYSITIIPEPSSALLVLIGSLGLIVRRRR